MGFEPGTCRGNANQRGRVPADIERKKKEKEKKRGTKKKKKNCLVEVTSKVTYQIGPPRVGTRIGEITKKIIIPG
jgi:hypothetical protein